MSRRSTAPFALFGQFAKPLFAAAVLLASVAFSACGGGVSGGIGDACNPPDFLTACGFFTSSSICDAKTKKCVAPIFCTKEADCADGYTCGPDKFNDKTYCARACDTSVMRCTAGHVCKADNTCGT